MARGKQLDQSFLLGHYVNDRPYVASSFMSVAIAQVFGSAMAGRCKDRPELVTVPLPLSARLEVLPIRGGESLVQKIFEPLGYSVEVIRHTLDEHFPEWGQSPYFTLTIRGQKTLSELLTHLYVLIPVFDNEKHYFVGDDELEKLLAKGEGWLAAHPEKESISRRYLRFQSSLYREALSRLVDASEEIIDGGTSDVTSNVTSDVTGKVVERRTGSAASVQPLEETLENALSLNEQRHQTVAQTLLASGARSVLDLGCGEGKLLRELLKHRQFEQILGLDVSIRCLELAQKRLKLERLPERQAERIKLIHGSLFYRDQRLAGFGAAALVEVIEHLDPPRLTALERVVFEFARPETVVLTTPNREYNAMWDTLPAGQFRHSDHRFEWTRLEFQTWARRVAEQHGYQVRFLPIGPEHVDLGPPTQMSVFELTDKQSSVN